uniref:Uncharacterized protein n=1 Tax=Timema tahoe TaxID=61484 RepID=A0A7R9NUA5_9NEOP|nr:unnamed protein product [Timema tahoe]
MNVVANSAMCVLLAVALCGGGGVVGRRAREMPIFGSSLWSDFDTGRVEATERLTPTREGGISSGQVSTQLSAWTQTPSFLTSRFRDVHDTASSNLDRMETAFESMFGGSTDLFGDLGDKTVGNSPDSKDRESLEPDTDVQSTGAMTRSDTRCPQPRSRFLDLREDPRTRKNQPKCDGAASYMVKQWRNTQDHRAVNAGGEQCCVLSVTDMSSSLFPGGLFNLFEIGTSRQPWWKGFYTNRVYMELPPCLMNVMLQFLYQQSVHGTASVSYECDVTVFIPTESTWKQALMICPGHECRTVVLTVVAIPLPQGSSGTASSLSSVQRLQFVVTINNLICGEN